MSKIKLTPGQWYLNSLGQHFFITGTDPYEPDLFIGVGIPGTYKSRFRFYFQDGRCYGQRADLNLVTIAEAPSHLNQQVMA